MYKSCKNCSKLTVHTEKKDNRTGRKVYTCKVCSGESKGLSYIQRAELAEKRAAMYQDKTFDDLLNFAQQEMQRDESNKRK